MCESGAVAARRAKMLETLPWDAREEKAPLRSLRGLIRREGKFRRVTGTNFADAGPLLCYTGNVK